MSWSFPLLARQVIHAADPPRSNPSWADKELLPGKKTLHDYVTNDVKKKVLRLMWSRCLKTPRFPQHP